MVLAAAGGVDHDGLVELAKKYFGKVPTEYPNEIPLLSPSRFTGSDLRYRDDSMPFVYGAIAVEGAGWENPDNIPLMIANTLIGTWDRSHGIGVNSPTRLAQRVGFGGECQSFQAFSTCYKDTGLWGTYFVTECVKSDQLMFNVLQEWKYLCQSVTDAEVEKAKNQLKTHMLLSLDGTTPIFEDIGRQILCYGRRIPWYELDARINAVDASTVRKVCMKYIYDRDPTVVAVGQTEFFEEYQIIRRQMNWWRA